MRAVRFHGPGAGLRLEEVERPAPAEHQLLVRVRACAVCRTDLHILDGELSKPKLPLVPGHQIVGEITSCGTAVQGFSPGDRVGVPWLGWTCGECGYCTSGRENLCDRALYTGYDLDGGYAEHAVADARYCFRIPAAFDDLQAAPLLCAGLIGYRCLRFAGDAERIGIYGFGSAAHLVTQVARYQGRRVFAFTRPGDSEAQRFAGEVGAEWAGASDQSAPEPLDAAIVFAPVGALIPAALKALVKGGTVVAGGIHMSDIPAFAYHLLWGERVIRSVANLTRADGEDFFTIAPRIPIHVRARAYRLEEADAALDALRAGDLRGAAVLVP
jgi:alcohol dehydrogenase, propanol-preferring